MRLLSLTAGLTAALLSSSAVLAQEEGFFTVNYKDIGFDLTQLGGYGELVVRPEGFGSMGFGECVVNFSLDETGAVKERGPVLQRNSATCPKNIEWELRTGQDGMYKIKFFEGSNLTGAEFDLFPVLQPWQEEWATKMPEGYDILGIAPGETRADTEAKLAAEGYEISEADSNTRKFEGGHEQSYVVYGKGERDYTGYEDQIAITYSTKIAGSDAPERSILLARRWNIPASAKLSIATLMKSLSDKYGQGGEVNNAVFYDTAGKVVPNAWELSCDKGRYLQQVQHELLFANSNDFVSTRIGCGAAVKVYSSESFDNPGLASALHLTLASPDAAYQDFWQSWSVGEAAQLKERFELQANSAEAPKL